MKAVAYYRTRPSEPEASAEALRLQVEAVRRAVEQDDYTLVAEFTEFESDAQTQERWPAYAAAVRAAVSFKEDANNSDVALLVASHSGIGKGSPFREPHVKGQQGLAQYSLNALIVPSEPSIALPPDAPAGLSLYAVFRPRQLDTVVYLCNAGNAPLLDVNVVMDSISMHDFYGARLYAPENRKTWDEAFSTYERQWTTIPANSCIMMKRLTHVVWDEVSRYRASFRDAQGERKVAEAHDETLRGHRSPDDPEWAWLQFEAIEPET